MGKNIQDLRVQKTLMGLSSSLLRILEKKNFSKVTVNDICEEAMISRSAFYSYFQDKYDLLEYSIKTINQSILEDIRTSGFKSKIYKLLENLKKNKKLLKNIIGETYDSTLGNLVHRKFEEDLKKIIITRDSDSFNLKCPFEISSVFYISGITSIIMYWLFKDNSYSIDDMVEYIFNLLPKDFVEEEGIFFDKI
ncbi:TetR/AcrR family transcriptional regulator [Anaerosphaera multitolerans]|uniref:TetR/AcrR family transcriptional regulator n=1 Tax=Anaerosphaera multitolerans TaxID=2487351 RepID=A0A437S5A6_9FIRM|nr:TetR/AcrR family transcriptional regulator [Anaerosphaera multitolerans]RVU54232.1 TetR/AcrR family transcriptional regulator [Anaerosphaera multitolerans]